MSGLASAFRVVHFVHAFNGRTLARIAEVLSAEMVALGCEVTIVAVTRSGAVRRLPDEVDVQIIGNGSPRGTTGSILALRRVLHRLRPDVVFAHGNGPVRATVLATRGTRPRPRVVGVEHNHHSSYDWNLRAVRYVANRSLLPRVDALVGVSSGVAEDLEATYPALSGRVGVIPPPLSHYDGHQRLAAAPVGHPWFSEDVPIVTSVGHVHPRKDHRTLVRAMGRVRDLAGPSAARLVIVGDATGAEADRLRALIAELRLDDQVALVGAQDNPLRFVARSTVFALSSRNEGMPVSILEAMALGVPVVSTDCPSGPAWILEGGRRGSLVPVGDSVALGDALLGMLADEGLRTELGRWGVDRAADFSPASIARAYLALAAGGPRPPASTSSP